MQGPFRRAERALRFFRRRAFLIVAGFILVVAIVAIWAGHRRCRNSSPFRAHIHSVQQPARAHRRRR